MSNHKLSRNERTTSIILYLVFFCLLLGTSFLRGNAGYMDESYYLIGARNLSEGKGFQEHILWNFMDDPDGLPHPSHLYWMPLVSILSAIGMKVFGSTYIAAAIPLAIISAFLSPLMYLVIKRWLKDQFWAIIGAVIIIFGGYYLAYYSAIDAFSLYMILGFGYFLIISKLLESNTNRIVVYGCLAGVLAGLMHLSRADGLLWAVMIPFFFLIAYIAQRENAKGQRIRYLYGATVGVVTYGLIMFPWFFRNLRLFGSITAAGSSQNLFLTKYDDLFVYPVSLLTPERWISLGIDKLFQQRIDAIGTNLLSLLGVQMLIVLLPFVIVGIWHNWKSVWVKVNVFGMGVLLIFFTVVFPLAGMRGSYFHSGTAFQIFLWSMSIYGLKHIIMFLPLNEGIDRKKFEYFLGIGFLVIIGAISVVLFTAKIETWRDGVSELIQIAQALDQSEINEDEVILINDPATFHWVSHRPSIVIPGGGNEMLLAVMEDYAVQFVVIQENHPAELHSLYLESENYEDFDVINRNEDWIIMKREVLDD